MTIGVCWKYMLDLRHDNRAVMERQGYFLYKWLLNDSRPSVCMAAGEQIDLTLSSPVQEVLEEPTGADPEIVYKATYK